MLEESRDEANRVLYFFVRLLRSDEIGSYVVFSLARSLTLPVSSRALFLLADDWLCFVDTRLRNIYVYVLFSLCFLHRSMEQDPATSHFVQGVLMES